MQCCITDEAFQQSNIAVEADCLSPVIISAKAGHCSNTSSHILLVGLSSALFAASAVQPVHCLPSALQLPMARLPPLLHFSACCDAVTSCQTDVKLSAHSLPHDVPCCVSVQGCPACRLLQLRCTIPRPSGQWAR